MKYGSVCSGIEAASVAWSGFGWKAAWLAEIEKFPSEVLAHHYPDVPNLGDMTTISRRVLIGEVEAPDVLVGGTPCQAFSIAGLREGLLDDRGQLTISYVRLFDAIDYIRRRAGKCASVAVWENVPGVLSSKDNAFGCFLGALAGEDVELVPPGKKWANAGCVFGPTRTVAWRTLDAQYFGVAQRRRRVFVVASARKDFDPVKVLFEFDGVRRDSAPSREAGQEVAGTVTSSLGRRCGVPDGGDTSGYLQPVASTGDLSHCLNAGGMGRQDFETETLVTQSTIAFDSRQDLVSSAHLFGSLSSSSPQAQAVCVFDPNQVTSGQNRSKPTAELSHTLPARSDPPVAYSVALRGREGGATAELGDEVGGCLRASTGGGDKPHVLAISGRARGDDGRGYERAEHISNIAGTLDTMKPERVFVPGMAVRRLMPIECERLQAFPDGYTSVPIKRGSGLSADGPRYKALGNSMCVNVMRWIGSRLEETIDA